MEKQRTGRIEKQEGVYVVYYRVNGGNIYKKEFTKKTNAEQFLFE